MAKVSNLPVKHRKLNNRIFNPSLYHHLKIKPRLDLNNKNLLEKEAQKYNQQFLGHLII